MLMIKKIVSLLIISAVLASCKKDQADETSSFSGENKPGATFELVGGPVMYTQSGPLTNINTIREFVLRRVPSAPNTFDYFFNGTTTSPVNIYTLKFLSGGNVTLTNNTATHNAKISNTLNNELKISFVDTQWVNYQDAFCNRLDGLINKYDQLTTCVNNNGSYFCYFFPLLNFEIEGDHLYQRFLTYLVSYTNSMGLNCVGVVGQGWDNFNPAIYSQMGPGDTIVTQHKRLKFTKQ